MHDFLHRLILVEGQGVFTLSIVKQSFTEKDLKVYIYSNISPVGSVDFTSFSPFWNSFFQSHLPREKAAKYSAAVDNHTVPIFVPTGTHYCWVYRAGVYSKLAQGFYT